MSIRELVQELESLDTHQLSDVAAYVSFLKFRTYFLHHQPTLDMEQIAQVYAEFADEDRQLAEENMNGYLKLLQDEDTK